MADEYAFHPIANLFPMLDDEALAELAADIKAHGLKEQIKLWRGQIIDGGNRYRSASSPGSSRSSSLSSFPAARQRRSYQPAGCAGMSVTPATTDRRGLQSVGRELFLQTLTGQLASGEVSKKEDFHGIASVGGIVKCSHPKSGPGRVINLGRG